LFLFSEERKALSLRATAGERGVVEGKGEKPRDFIAASHGLRVPRRKTSPNTAKRPARGEKRDPLIKLLDEKKKRTLTKNTKGERKNIYMERQVPNGVGGGDHHSGEKSFGKKRAPPGASRR